MATYINPKVVDTLHDQQFQICQLLQEQFDYLMYLSVDQLHTNVLLYEKIKSLNERLKIQSYTVLKSLKNLSVEL